MPFLYHPDERTHFVPYAISFFQNGYNPQYFVNPPAFSYFLNAMFWLRYWGGQNAFEAYFNNPTDVFLTARVVTAALGTVVVWLVYLVGRRLFDARVGLISALLIAVAFLPTFHSHLAMNNVPTMVPVLISVLASVWIFLEGKRIHYIVAGAALGVAVATKYLGGVAAVPFLVAGVLRIIAGDKRSQVFTSLGFGALATLGGLFIANPFAFLEFQPVVEEVGGFFTPGGILRNNPKVGMRFENGWGFYLWSLTWGFGWLASIAAVAGAVLVARKNRAVAALLVPAPILFVLVMGARPRYFGRYLLPIYPFLAILAAFALVQLAGVLRRRFGRVGLAAGVAVLIAVLAQPLAHSIHTNLVLTRPDTRLLARNWIYEHIPKRTPIFVEPVGVDLRETIRPRLPRVWRSDPRPWRMVSVGHLLYWAGSIPREEIIKFIDSIPGQIRRLRPEFVDVMIERGVCWVITGSSQWGRVLNDPQKVPQAVEYYEELARRGRVAFRLKPYTSDRAPPWDFDLSLNHYRFEVRNPGPEIIIYSLPAAGCRGTNG